MQIFALEPDNDVVGSAARKQVIGQMIAQLNRPDLVVLPELAICGFAGDTSIWQHADSGYLNRTPFGQVEFGIC